MELRRDALIAVELLYRYVRENLGTEIKFVGELAIRKDKASDQNRQSLVAEFECVKDDVLKSLDMLKKEVQTVGSDNNFQQGSLDWEINDITPFIPGFTGEHLDAHKSDQIKRSQNAVSQSMSFNQDLEMSGHSLVHGSGLSDERFEAMKAVSKFRDTVNVIVEQYLDILGQEPVESLEGRAEIFKRVEKSYDRMASKLAILLESDRVVDDFRIMD